MLEEPSLLRHICEYPDDDGARLVYADWLAENGQEERSEFIRLQIELSKKPECPDWCDNDPAKCRVAAMEQRERELLKRYGNRWVPKVLRLTEYEWFGTIYAQKRRPEMSVDELLQSQSCAFRRGFIAKVECTAKNWLEHCEEIVIRCPIDLNRGVRLSDRVPQHVLDGMSLPYSWSRQPISDNSYSVGGDLYKHLRGVPTFSLPGIDPNSYTETMIAESAQHSWRKWYLSALEAYDDLSRAALLRARRVFSKKEAECL